MKGPTLALGTAAIGGLLLVGVAANLSHGVAPPLDAPAAAKRRPPAPALGLRVVALDAAAARALKIAGGLSVVQATGAAYAGGLRNADVIVDVGGKAVSEPVAFWDAVAAANWQPTLRVLRDGKPLSVRIGAEPSAIEVPK